MNDSGSTSGATHASSSGSDIAPVRPCGSRVLELLDEAVVDFDPRARRAHPLKGLRRREREPVLVGVLADSRAASGMPRRWQALAAGRRRNG